MKSNAIGPARRGAGLLNRPGGPTLWRAYLKWAIEREKDPQRRRDLLVLRAGLVLEQSSLVRRCTICSRPYAGSKCVKTARLEHLCRSCRRLASQTDIQRHRKAIRNARDVSNRNRRMREMMGQPKPSKPSNRCSRGGFSKCGLRGRKVWLSPGAPPVILCRRHYVEAMLAMKPVPPKLVGRPRKQR